MALQCTLFGALVDHVKIKLVVLFLIVVHIKFNGQHNYVQNDSSTINLNILINYITSSLPGLYYNVLVLKIIYDNDLCNFSHFAFKPISFLILNLIFNLL